MAKTPATRKSEKSGLNRPVIALPKPDTSESTAVTPMNFRVPETFHRKFKLYAVQNGISMVDLLQESFRALKVVRGE